MTAPHEQLTAKRVLITGASGAIGAATAEALRARGARVLGIDRVRAHHVLEADLCEDEAVERAVKEAIERLGGLDILINNAGIGDAHDAGAPPDERANAIVDVNLFGAWRVTGHAMPGLLASRGRVVNVASGMAIANLPLAAAYMASKRGLAAWSDALRLEYGGTISVTTIYSGYIRTPFTTPPLHAASRWRAFSRPSRSPPPSTRSCAPAVGARAGNWPPHVEARSPGGAHDTSPG